MSFLDTIVYYRSGHVLLSQKEFEALCKLLPDSKHHFWLTEEQMARIRDSLPKSRGKRRVDDRKVLSGIIHVLKTGCRWRDAPKIYGSYSTLYSRFKRWGRARVFDRILWGLAGLDADLFALMIDSTYIPAHRTACSLAVLLEEDLRGIGHTAGGWTSKIHTVADMRGRPLLLLVTGGNVSDYDGADYLADYFPKAEHFLGDRGYDANWLRARLEKMGTEPCIKPRKNRKKKIDYDTELYKKRHRVENCFNRLKDWRRVWVRYDRCPRVYAAACTLAAIVMFWL